MESSYYLGSLCLRVEPSDGIIPDQYGRKFLDPALPVAKTVRIKCSDHPLFPKGEQAGFTGGKVWVTDGGEYRRYHSSQTIGCEITSFYSMQENTVFLHIPGDMQDQARDFMRLLSCIHLEELLMDNNAMILHSASIAYCGGAILFTAPSGTGKTTQTDLWHKYCKNVDDINGDKTLLQQTANGWYACGFPFYGGSFRCEQTAVPIRAVVIIRQSKQDKIRELSEKEKTALLYSEMTIPSFNKGYVLKSFDLISRFLLNIPVIRMDCTASKAAVSLLHKYLYGGD